jgi:bisphosphoglycerate-dependent phosphoglycerate mutase
MPADDSLNRSRPVSKIQFHFPAVRLTCGHEHARFLIRHGATVLTAEDRFAGSTDVELSDEGREQARQLAERLRREKMIAIYASPLGRTIETARIIAQPHDLEVVRREGCEKLRMAAGSR